MGSLHYFNQQVAEEARQEDQLAIYREELAAQNAPKQFFVTYGCGSNLGHKYSVVEAATYDEARAKIVAVAGRNWGFIYDAAQFEGQVVRHCLEEVPLQAQILS